MDPLLSGDLLKILVDMGDGDQLVLVDHNYPAAASGNTVVRLGDVGRVLAAEWFVEAFGVPSDAPKPEDQRELAGITEEIAANGAS